ncbi:ABC transporter permease [Actinomadura parmotrematis]|uniref:ABC transporter permease n=1 Tax=Actinomadura parmotrematis TaxID=2864039 RepID=A0ABS7FT43_9ACTN|nr:ABC transporter permease [Actinomadura parmotrematis]MBW8483576.1 ABC transporter permease [Actinomadura parmotrematis]
MLVFLLRRLAGHAVLAVLAASLAYLLAAAALRPRAEFEDRSPRPPAAVVDAELDRLNLNDRTPLADRYRVWATGVLHGDFGRTWQGDPVNGELGRRLLVSLRLLTCGAVAGGVLGVLLGAWAAVSRHRATDRAITFGSYLLLAVPVFVLAVLLQIGASRVNDATGVRLFAWVGETGPGASGGAFGPLGGLGDRVRHLLLPSATIALAQLALFCRYQRGTMLDVLHADFVRTARAKGLRRRDALLRHGLRTALVPVATYFAYTSGLLLLGAMFTEKIFGWHGLGEWLIDSITRGDVNVVAAVDCLAAAAVLLAGLASDVLQGALDPRARAGAR